MNLRPRALLVDDDVWFQRAFKACFESQLPHIQLEVRREPDVSGDFGLYLLDNHFRGEARAGGLAREIRKTNRESLIIALSATLDAATLKTLLNEGCNGACEKGNQNDLMRMFGVIRNFFERNDISDRRTPNTRESGMFRALRSITELFREWNARLAREADEEATVLQNSGPADRV